MISKIMIFFCENKKIWIHTFSNTLFCAHPVQIKSQLVQKEYPNISMSLAICQHTSVTYFMTMCPLFGFFMSSQISPKTRKMITWPRHLVYPGKKFKKILRLGFVSCKKALRGTLLIIKSCPDRPTTFYL